MSKDLLIEKLIKIAETQQILLKKIANPHKGKYLKERVMWLTRVTNRLGQSSIDAAELLNFSFAWDKPETDQELNEIYNEIVNLTHRVGKIADEEAKKFYANYEIENKKIS